MKKTLAAIMSAVMLLSLLVMPAYAQDISDETQLVLQGEIIPPEVAEILAEQFVQSNVSSQMETAWNSSTKVKNTVTLYDEKDIPSAYSVEFETDGKSSGYVVISAYPDMERYILEYADKEKPLYEEFDENETEKVVYTGTLEYYQDTGDDELIDLMGEEISKDDVVNTFEEMRDPEEKAVVQETIQEIAAGRSVSAASVFVNPDGRDGYGTIVAPDLYIKYFYGDYPVTCVEWKSLEQYCKHRNGDMFRNSSAIPNGNCGPTAITNLLETVGNIRNISMIKNTNVYNMYSNIERIGIDKKYILTPSTLFPTGYTDGFKVGAFIQAVFKAYGVNVTSRSIGSFSYETIKKEINANRPFLITLEEHETYGGKGEGHIVMGYAYTRFQYTHNKGIKSFVKVADGWADSGRYIDLATVVGKWDQEIWTAE